MQWLLVFAFGGLGAALRVGVSHLFPVRALPWGTLLVNIAGCLAIGALYHFFESRPPLVGPWRVALVGGLLGGFTTFSAFGLETWQLLQSGRAAAAVLYALGSVALGIAAVGAGIALARSAA